MVYKLDSSSGTRFSRVLSIDFVGPLFCRFIAKCDNCQMFCEVFTQVYDVDS